TYAFGSSANVITISHINPGSQTMNLLANVDLGSVRTLKASHQLKPAIWEQPIITTPETPLLIAGENNSKRIAALGFDIHDSDLPLQPSFPILIHNLVNWFLPPPVSDEGQVSPGLPVTIQSWPGADKVTITSPNKQDTLVGPPIAPYAQTDQVGIYQVTEHVRGQNMQGAFVVNLFNPDQSHLAPAPALPVLRSSDFTPTGPLISHELREIWPWIAAILLLILCTEWWLFSRSYQQRAAATTQRNSALTSGTNRTGNTPLTRLRNQLEDRYIITRKRFLKTLKRTRRKLARGTGQQVRQTTKGKRNANL
ncbi:MAG: hypothetical protein J2P37_25030, partial [Ktedonobacteraceae bacterium]|nr:hypothetical protein [Ktedonobacteraceae bacterium]